MNRFILTIIKAVENDYSDFTIPPRQPKSNLKADMRAQK